MKQRVDYEWTRSAYLSKLGSMGLWGEILKTLLDSRNNDWAVLFCV